jgi:lipopolysaccharide biosynthesis regulator YciM
MAEGFLLDRIQSGAASPADWIEGEPEKSLWTVTKFVDKLKYRILSYRCRECGYLEFYANE